ncbi:hypothetical protein GGR42_002226 [Saonia flava]|uniref:Uncharacterized protein n=1 Tax=Saonia flava TaxID=523696 RepID=A0A846R323_9FLAO|nr:hypothetical protein [Saonia flava]
MFYWGNYNLKFKIVDEEVNFSTKYTHILLYLKINGKK